MFFTNGNYIKIDETRCLNLIHNGVECSHCMQHCPADAIVYSNEHIYLNKDQCIGCGLCFSDCPTEVFGSNQWDETAIIRDIEDEGWKITEFFCDRHTQPYKMDKSKDRGAVVLPACLSAVSRGAWYELGLKTEIEIHLDQCKECQMAKTKTRLEYNVGMAAEWIKASGQTPLFTYIYQESQGKTKKSLLAFETGLKVTSRRDLFISLINKGQRLTSNAPDKIDSTSHKKIQNSCLPDWQKRLSEVFPKHMDGRANPADWPIITINHQCVNCGLCTRYCPAGTLQITEKDGVCTHHFTSGLCLDCRICQLFCPGEAISRNRESDERPFDVKSIYSTSSAKCRRSGSLTENRDEELCYWCKHKDTTEKEITDSLRKILF